MLQDLAKRGRTKDSKSEQKKEKGIDTKGGRGNFAQRVGGEK